MITINKDFHLPHTPTTFRFLIPLYLPFFSLRLPFSQFYSHFKPTPFCIAPLFTILPYPSFFKPCKWCNFCFLHTISQRSLKQESICFSCYANCSHMQPCGNVSAKSKGKTGYKFSNKKTIREKY